MVNSLGLQENTSVLKCVGRMVISRFTSNQICFKMGVEDGNLKVYK